MSKQKLINRPVAELQPYARNSRTHSKEQVAQIAASIQEFGFLNPVLVDAGGQIIAGHGRVLAAQQLGLAEVPCLLVEGLSEAQIRAYVIADNKLAENAGWDNNLLAGELAELRDGGFDLDLLGFSLDEMALLMPELPGEGLTDPDEVPDLPEEPVSKLGDIWQLGDHRLMCGDSTDDAAIKALMNGEKAGLMNTDPPYGVAYNNAERPNPGVAKPRVANDTLEDEKLQEFLEKTFLAAVNHALNKNAAWYMWHAHLTQGYFAAAAAAANVVLHRQIIWVKNNLLLGRGQYHWKHEPCFMGWVKGQQPPDYGRGAGERNQVTIWEIASVGPKQRKEFNHSTPKPVELFKIPIIKHLRKGELCFEPFSGSGSQIVAAEENGRRCYAMELSPAYVDVGVRRWENFTGKKAVLCRSEGA